MPLTTLYSVAEPSLHCRKSERCVSDISELQLQEHWYMLVLVTSGDARCVVSKVSNLKKCLSDETLAILFDDKLHFIEEPIEIMDREVKHLKQSRIPIVKVRMDYPNITIEEYIRLEEEKAQNCGKVFKWETVKYDIIWKTLSCEPTVSSLNNEIDFKISFDDFDDEDYTVMFDKNSFSYKIISTNDLKTDSENDNEKVNMPSLPPPEPTISYFDDLDFFKDFENKFLAIVYNDAPTSKLDLLTEPILSPQHIEEIDLNKETSLSEYNEEEQNVLYFNNLLSLNIIHPDDLKSEKDKDDREIDIIQSSRGPRERNINEYWWRIYKSRDLEVLES
ncbi:hypothetical protein Tco_0299640 [Tanacetum coccineum]